MDRDRRLDYIREQFTFMTKDKRVWDSLKNEWIKRGKPLEEVEEIIKELKYR